MTVGVACDTRAGTSPTTTPGWPRCLAADANKAAAVAASPVSEAGSTVAVTVTSTLRANKWRAQT